MSTVIAEREKTKSPSIAYDAALEMIKDSYKRGKIFDHSLHSSNCLSRYEILSTLALPKSVRKEIIKKYIHTHDALDIITVGVLAWVICQTLSEHSEKEKVILENFFIRYEEKFDARLNDEGLLSVDERFSWPPDAQRKGCLVEIQSLYINILNVLFSLTNDDMYPFKKKRMLRVIREKLGGAYILDREDSLEMRPNAFISAFFAPEMFLKKDWEKTFDSFLKNLWLSWGGLATLRRIDDRYDAERDGSWFFVNNMSAIVLSNLNYKKYKVFVDKIFQMSTENIVWQDHVGRPCEIFINERGNIKNGGHFSLSIATYIYLYRTLKK